MVVAAMNLPLPLSRGENGCFRKNEVERRDKKKKPTLFVKCLDEMTGSIKWTANTGKFWLKFIQTEVSGYRTIIL